MRFSQRTFACSLVVLSAVAAFCQSGPPPIPPGSEFPLNSWSLSAVPWDSDFGDPSRAFTGLNVVPSWGEGGTCLSVDTNSQAFLNIEVYQQPDNWTNISVDSSNGSLSFWYQPNYTSVADGESGPGKWAALINIGAYTTNAFVGDWLLAIDPPASNILFLTASGGSRQVVFKYPIDMDAGDWWQIGVSWSSTNTCLYLNGLLATNGGPVAYRPTYNECLEHGVFVGSLGTNGDNQARGQFQNLLSYDYPLSPDEVARDYARGSAAILDWGGTIPGGGGFHANDSGPPEVGGGDGGGNTNSPPFFNFTQPTNGLWLEMTGVSNGTAYLNLHNATNYVYEVFSTTDLNAPWNIETEVFPGTNQPTTPFTVAQAERGDLFLWARDWTGITSNDNQTPDWWFWYFGTVGLSDASLDSGGHTLLSDFQQGKDPNVIAFNLSVTNKYVNTSNVPMQITVSAGTPYYMAALVDDTNLANANWIPYTPSPVVPIGTNEGWHQVWFGLRGLPPMGQQTWAWSRVKLVTTPPLLVITNPSTTTVMQPIIEVQGFCPQPLASLTFDLSNAAGSVSNQQAILLGKYYDTNTLGFTTNTFQAFDIPLTNGANLLTFHATDPAGNVTVANFTYTLDYAGKTNAPSIQVYWPQNGDHVSGTGFTLRGALDDFTASLTAQIVDTSGNTNVIQGLVERNGLFWVENAPLLDGTNYITLAAMDAVSNITTTNLTIHCVNPGLTIDDFSGELGGAPRNVISIVTGSVEASGCTVWVNGVQATQDGQGNWEADAVPVGPGGTAVVEARAIPNTDNNGNGSGSAPMTDGTPRNPTAMDSTAAQTQIDQPPYWYVDCYSESGNSTVNSTWTCGPCPELQTLTSIWNTSAGWLSGGSAYDYEANTMGDCNGTETIWYSDTYNWSCDTCAGTDAYADCGGYAATNAANPTSGSWLSDFAAYGSGGMATFSWSEQQRGKFAQGDCPTNTFFTASSQNICSTVKLMTGGKGKSRVQSMFGIFVSATEDVPCEGTSALDLTDFHWETKPIPPTSINDQGQAADTNGAIYALLPDNTTADITPQASPACYTYWVTAAKYPATFTVYVDMPGPPPSHVTHTSLSDWGHAWWSLSCNAPSDAFTKYATPNQTHFLGEQVGYADQGKPHGDGVLRDPETDHNISVQKTYNIGFTGLISGLQFTQNLHDNPGKYDVLFNNCVENAVEAGAAAGASLPGDTKPETFGWDIYKSQ